MIKFKCSDITKRYKVTINFDYIVKENIKQHIPNWQQVLVHPYKILIVRGSGSRKKKSWFNITNRQPVIDRVYLYAKDTKYEAKYQLLISKRASTGLNHFNDSKVFTEHWKKMVDIYKNIEDYNPNKTRKILIVFDDMIPDMLSNKNT